MTKQKRGSGQGCIVCLHPQAEQILKALEAGTPISYIPAKFNHDFSRQTLHRHIKNCLQSSHSIFQEKQRINLVSDVNQRFQFLLNETEEALSAVRDLLLVDGELNFNPRAWEIRVVYEDHNDTNREGDPKQKTATLDKLLARLEGEGFLPKRVHMQTEDFRKSYRETLKLVDSLVDRFAKLMGAYKPEEPDETKKKLEHIRDTVEYAARKLNTSYKEELSKFLEIYGHRLRADLRDILKRELAMGGMPEKHAFSLGALPAPRRDVEKSSQNKE